MALFSRMQVVLVLMLSSLAVFAADLGPAEVQGQYHLSISGVTGFQVAIRLHENRVAEIKTENVWYDSRPADNPRGFRRDVGSCRGTWSSEGDQVRLEFPNCAGGRRDETLSASIELPSELRERLTDGESGSTRVRSNGLAGGEPTSMLVTKWPMTDRRAVYSWDNFPN